MNTSSVAAEAVDRKWSIRVPAALISAFQRLSMRARLVGLCAFCAMAIVATRWGYAFAVPPHTPIYANFDIGFQYLYADYFRDHGAFPSAPADISQGASDGYFWWWWNNEYYSNYMGFAAAMVGSLMWLGVPFIPAYAIITWLADAAIAALSYRLVSAAAGRRGGAIAALLVSVNPLFVWGMYQSHVQISVGMALFLAVVACWRWWSNDGRRLAVALAAVFALAASHAHAFYLSMLLGTFLPAVALHTLLFQRNRRAIVQQIVFAGAVTLALLANTRFWLHLDAYSEVTKWMIGRGDSWGQLPSPLFLLGISARPDSWNFSVGWLVLGAFLVILAFSIVQSLRARDLDPPVRALSVLFGVMFVIDVAYMIGAHRIRYDYWILRHAQFHSVLGVLPASVGLGWLVNSHRLSSRAVAWASAAAVAAMGLSISISKLDDRRSHGPAFAQFISDVQRPKLPYFVLAYPGGTALTPFTCGLTETPTYDLHPGTISPLLEHLQSFYGWKPGDEVNVLWYSEVSPLTREAMHFTQVLGEWSTPDESVVLGKVRVNFGDAPAPLNTPTANWALTDRLSFGDATNEAAHQYRVDAPTFKGTSMVFLDSDQMLHVKSARATKTFEEFRVKVDPHTDHVLVKGFDTISGGQVARVIVGNGAAVLLWNVGTGSERYAESTLSIPASAIGNNTEIALRVEYVGGTLGINSYGYWMYSKPTLGIEVPLMSDTNGYVLTDRLDVGDASDEAAHEYGIVNPTFGGNQVFRVRDKGSYMDAGRATKDDETFRLRTTPGIEHLLVKAYDNYSKDQVVRVLVDGKLVGDWALPGNEERYEDSAFVIPASFIRGDSVEITMQFVSASIAHNSFGYWMYAKAPNPAM